MSGNPEMERTDPEAGLDPARLDMAKRLYWADVMVRDAIALQDAPSGIRDEWRDEWWRTDISMPLSGGPLLRRWLAVADAALAGITGTEHACTRDAVRS